jgi:hypothetical protein
MPAIQLEGRRLTFHRALQTAGLLFALVAVVTCFLPRHAVYDSGFGLSLSCAFMPDCHASPSVRTDEQLERRAPDEVHTVFDHSPVVPLVLLLMAGFELLSLLRVRLWIGVATAVAGLPALFLLLMSLVDLSHMFDHVRILPAGRIHDGALIGLSLAAIADLFAQPILHIGARRAAARAAPPALPGARALRTGPTSSDSAGS